MADSPFGFQKPEDSLGFLLWQTTITWQRLIRKVLDPYDISHAQFVILALLLWFEEHKIQPTQVLLIDKSKLDKMTVSNSLKKLVSLGLVQRVEDQIDTRAKRVSITKQGKVFIKKLIPLVEKIDEGFFACMNPEEQKILSTLFSRLLSEAVLDEK